MENQLNHMYIGFITNGICWGWWKRHLAVTAEPEASERAF